MANANETPSSPPPENQIPPPPPLMPEPIIHLNFPIATKLTPTNLTWKSQIFPLIHGYNLTKYLEDPPPDKALRTAHWDRQDQMLLGWIRSSLTKTIQGQVASCLTTSALWSSLVHSYSVTSQARLNDLCRQIQSSTKGSASCLEYLNRMHSLADELAFIGHPMSDDDLISAVLTGLSPEFTPFVISVTTSSRDKPYTFPDLHSMLVSFEKLIQNHSPNNSSLPSTDSPSAFLAKPDYKNNQSRPVNSPGYHNYSQNQTRPQSPYSNQPRPNLSYSQNRSPAGYNNKTRPQTQGPKPPADSSQKPVPDLYEIRSK